MIILPQFLPVLTKTPDQLSGLFDWYNSQAGAGLNKDSNGYIYQIAACGGSCASVIRKSGAQNATWRWYASQLNGYDSQYFDSPQYVYPTNDTNRFHGSNAVMVFAVAKPIVQTNSDNILLSYQQPYGTDTFKAIIAHNVSGSWKPGMLVRDNNAHTATYYSTTAMDSNSGYHVYVWRCDIVNGIMDIWRDGVSILHQTSIGTNTSSHTTDDTYPYWGNHYADNAGGLKGYFVEFGVYQYSSCWSDADVLALQNGLQSKYALSWPD